MPSSKPHVLMSFIFILNGQDYKGTKCVCKQEKCTFVILLFGAEEGNEFIIIILPRHL